MFLIIVYIHYVTSVCLYFLMSVGFSCQLLHQSVVSIVAEWGFQLQFVLLFLQYILVQGQVEKPCFGHGRTSDYVRNFLKTMNYLNMILYKNERFPFSCLMQVKTFSLFQSKFSLWLAKDLVTEVLQRRVKLGKCCSWLISCEIIMSSLMKPTEKFVQYLHIHIQLHL